MAHDQHGGVPPLPKAWTLISDDLGVQSKASYQITGVTLYRTAVCCALRVRPIWVGHRKALSMRYYLHPQIKAYYDTAYRANPYTYITHSYSLTVQCMTTFKR